MTVFYLPDHGIQGQPAGANRRRPAGRPAMRRRTKAISPELIRAELLIGFRVRQARLAKGMSQNELGRAIGVSFQQVQKYEAGATRIATSRLCHIARVLDQRVMDLLEGVAPR